MRQMRLAWSSPGLLATAFLCTPFVCVPALGAQEQTDVAKAESFAAVQKEYDAATRAWSKDYTAARQRGASKEELAKVMQARPLPTKYVPRFLAIMDAAPKDRAALDSAVWLVTFGGVKDGELDKALGVLLEHHMGSADLGVVCSALGRMPTPAAGNFLRMVEAKNPHDAVKGQACFALAQNLGRQASLARSLKSDPSRAKSLAGYYGREAMDVLKSASAEDLEKESEKLYEKVASTEAYAAQKHYRGDLGKAASAALFELRNLAIGKVAPEIEGEDLDGNPIKLSDYRGKVVVLDFWGDW